jgi:hypothetical protein
MFRGLPQLSMPLFGPHVAPLRAQNAASSSAVHPHTFAAPPPPQVVPGVGHPPQVATVRALPHVSVPLTLPHDAPRRLQNAQSGSTAQPHTFGLPPPPQVSPVPLHEPQLATVRDLPQLSTAVFAPHTAPVRAHSCASDSGVHPHTLSLPPPPQVTPGPLHVPQLSTLRSTPQLSLPLALPQLTSRRLQNAAMGSGVHPHTFGFPPPPQVWSALSHAPQLATVRDLPQLSTAVFAPHTAPVRAHSCASVSGVHPHTLSLPPPPQVTPGPLHVPQLSTLRSKPQLSVALAPPQLTPARLQNAAVGSGVHPHTLGFPPPPQLCPVPSHAPQLATFRIMPQLSSTDFGPHAAPVRVQSCASDSGVQPQVPGLPPPPQVTPTPEQLPQLSTLRSAPQLSAPLATPQVTDMRLQNAAVGSGVQPHTLGFPPPPQLCPAPSQVPQLATARSFPQLSAATFRPHTAP